MSREDPVKQHQYNQSYYARNKPRLDAQNKVYRETHKDQIRDYLADWREKNPDWMKNYRIANRETIRKQIRQDCLKHREKYNKARKIVSENLRREFLVRFGQSKSGHPCGVCPCCGEDLLRFGTIHHINGDGKEHRKHKCHHAMLREAITSGDKSRFAALCFNCNLAAERNGGHCPGHSDGGEV
jgi:hypothetical protein